MGAVQAALTCPCETSERSKQSAPYRRTTAPKRNSLTDWRRSPRSLCSLAMTPQPVVLARPRSSRGNLRWLPVAEPAEAPRYLEIGAGRRLLPAGRSASERSEGSRRQPTVEMFRCAQHDNKSDAPSLGYSPSGAAKKICHSEPCCAPRPNPYTFAVRLSTGGNSINVGFPLLNQSPFFENRYNEYTNAKFYHSRHRWENKSGW